MKPSVDDLIHEYLAERGDTTPSDMTKWLYRDVLKADLDDPYLGLGELLFSHTEASSTRSL